MRDVMSDLRQSLRNLVRDPRSSLVSIGLFAVTIGVTTALGAALATTGLISVVCMVVSLQRRELALRAALGATSRQLQTFVLADAFWTTSIAIVAGLAGALAGGRLLDGMLVGTSAYDAFSLAAAAVVTFVAACAGCFLAARGATRISPADALRD